ncbi:MAG TPA: hypothetical protein VF815_04955, partial [Myxococcaceae bacterium]
TSIRRLLSGISTSATWAARYEVSAPVRQKPTAPVEPVRRGFSDQSDFQSAAEAEGSPLSARAPYLAGSSRKAREALSVYSGMSDFQAALPRYQHLLGVNIPPPPARLAPAAPRFQQAAPVQDEATRERATRPGLGSTADLQKAFEQASEEDQVRLYSNGSDEGGRSVIRHPDGSVTDPRAPGSHFKDLAAWERANPGLTHAASLSRNDLELVLAMPEGEARDEVLAELASADTGLDSFDAAGGDFMPSLDDLPVNAEPEEATASADAFMPSMDDLPASSEPAEALLEPGGEDRVLSAEELESLLSPTGALAGGQRPLDVAVQVAQRGTSEQQARAATALYERSQEPAAVDAPAYQHGAALVGSSSPEATQALLQRMGEAGIQDFVRTMLQA